MRKRQDIQGLRGWAIIMVVLFHFFPQYFPNGYVGVDIFFVISGYLIAMILIKNEQTNFSTIKLFYYKRVKRIFPLYYLVIIFALLLTFHDRHPMLSAINAESALKAMLYISNFKSKNMNNEYKRMLSEADDLFTHTWSLSVEMQWYLLVPLIFIIQQYVTSRQKTFFVGIGLCSFTFYCSTDTTTSFYSIFSRTWQFICGVIVCLTEEDKAVTHLFTKDSIELTDMFTQLRKGVGETCETLKEEPNTRSGLNKIVGTRKEITFLGVRMIVFSTSMFACLFWLSIPTHLIRIPVTLSSALLLYIGGRHKLTLLSHQIIAYTGDISYALYLYHWPVYVKFNTISCQPLLALPMGVIISVTLASVTYHFFESYYLKSSPFVIIWLVITLITTCALLSYQLRMDYVILDEVIGANYTYMDSSQAKWNDAQKQYLGLKALNIRNNMLLTRCTYNSRFTGINAKPYGFCTKENGTGSYHILVAGNSFACNQGDLVYDAFQQHARQFSVFCLPGCEVMTKPLKHRCTSHFNYSVVFDELKPDIIFILSRVLAAKQRLNLTQSTIDKDTIFRDYMSYMRKLEMDTKKIYLLQALPSCKRSCGKNTWDYVKRNRPLEDIKKELIDRDEFFGRLRIKEVGKRCKKCEIIDYMPEFLDEWGHYLGYNENDFLYMDGLNHFTPFGKLRIRPVFTRLAENFGKNKVY